MPDTYVDARDVAYILNMRLPGLTDQFVKACPLFDKMKQNGCVKFNQDMPAGAEFAINTGNDFLDYVTSIGDWANAQAHTANNRSKLTTPYSNLHAALAISKLFQDRIKNGQAAKFAYFDELKEKMNDIENALLRTLCSDIYADGSQRSGSPLTPVVGLAGMILATGTYCGVNRATSGNEYWQSQVGAVTGNHLTETTSGVQDVLQKMRQVSSAIEIQGSRGDGVQGGQLPSALEKWDNIFSDPRSVQDYESSVESRVRFMGDGPVSRGSAKNPVFEGREMIPDPFCTTKTHYFLQYKRLKFRSCYSNLFDIVAEDKTNLTQAAIYVGQFTFHTDKPNVLGKVTHTTYINP